MAPHVVFEVRNLFADCGLGYSQAARRRTETSPVGNGNQVSHMSHFHEANLSVFPMIIKMGQSEYDVRTNVATRTVQELANIPLKQVNGTTIYLHDVASVSDGFQVQTNIVRQDGHRGVLISILKNGNASTFDVVKGVRAMLPRIASTVPPNLKMTPLSDQSFFVRAAVQGSSAKPLLPQP